MDPQYSSTFLGMIVHSLERLALTVVFFSLLDAIKSKTTIYFRANYSLDNKLLTGNWPTGLDI